MELKNERRKHKRLKYETRIFHNVLSLGIIHTGKLYNLSFDGLYFESDQTLYSGEEINIWLGDRTQSAYDDRQPFLGVKIIWYRDQLNSNLQYGYGAKIIKNSDDFFNHLNMDEFKKKSPQNNNSSKGRDSRKCPRRLYHKQFLFTHQNRRCEGYIKNISRTGAFIETKNELVLGKIIILAIPTRKGHKGTKLRGWIVRIDKKGAGVKFDLRSGRERRSDLDRRIGLERRSRDKYRYWK